MFATERDGYLVINYPLNINQAMVNEISNLEEKFRIQIIYELFEELQIYKTERRKGSQYHNFLKLGVAKETKLDAVNKLIYGIESIFTNEFRDPLMLTNIQQAALLDGKLKSIVYKSITNICSNIKSLNYKYNEPLTPLFIFIDIYRKINMRNSHLELRESIKKTLNLKYVNQKKDLLIVFDYSRLKNENGTYTTIIYEMQNMFDSVLGIDNSQNFQSRTMLKTLFGGETYRYPGDDQSNIKNNGLVKYNFHSEVTYPKKHRMNYFGEIEEQNDSGHFDPCNMKNTLSKSMQLIDYKYFTRLNIAISRNYKSNPPCIVFSYSDLTNIEEIYDFLFKNGFREKIVIKLNQSTRGKGNFFIENLNLKELNSILLKNVKPEYSSHNKVFLIEKQIILSKINKPNKVYRACCFYSPNNKYFKAMNIKSFISKSIDSHQWHTQRYYGIDEPVQLDRNNDNKVNLTNSKIERNITSLKLYKKELNDTFYDICKKVDFVSSHTHFIKNSSIKQFGEQKICIFSENARNDILDDLEGASSS